MSDDSGYPVLRLSPEAHAKFMEALDNPKPPTPALIALMKEYNEDTIKRVAARMEARRAELINQPLARIWEELATVAVAEMRNRP